MALPSNVDLGFVSGTVILGDGTAASGGRVTFTPEPAWVRDPTATPPATVLPIPVTVNLDSNGQIPTTTTASAAGKTGQHLIASLDPDIDPTGWTWKASFSFVSGSRDPFNFTLDVGEQKDITTAGSSAASTGTATGGIVGGIGITTIRKLTAAEYAAITTPDAYTLYVVAG